MDHIFSFANRLVDSPHLVAIAIGEPNCGQRHIGILHRTDDSQPFFLHLEWHCTLQNDKPLPKYLTLWIATTVPPARQRSLTAVCRRVWRKNSKNGIPYAFSKPDESIDPKTGAFLKGPTRFGLTCASFVLAVFDVAGLPIAEYESWTVDRPGDRDWQEEIVRLLRKRAEPEHIAHVNKEIGSVRFRPEEVAACISLAPPPATFSKAEKLGIQILDRLKE